MRALLMLLIGLAAGAICGSVATRNMAMAHAYPRGVMAVLQVRLSAAKREIARAEQCDDDLVRGHFEAIDRFGAEIGPAIKSADDARKQELVEIMRKASAAASATASALPCAELGAVAKAVGDACNECHREYR